jgi:agmatinase
MITPRFAGVRTFMRLPHVTDMSDVDVAVVGFPFDTGTSYRSGARFGPEAVRSASVLLRPYHPVHGIDLVEELSVVDAGDVAVQPGNVEGTFAAAEGLFGSLVEAGVFPIVIGGDHTITLAELRALARRFGKLSLVHLDAHADLWDSYFGQRYFHGTTFRRAVEEGLIDPEASLQAGMRGPLYGSEDLRSGRDLGFTVLSAEELRKAGAHGLRRIVSETVGARPVFVSFDVDVCDPAYAPGTGTPEVGGLTSAEAIDYLRALAGLTLVGCDVVELSPPYDSPGQPTALLAANAAWELLTLAALQPNWRTLKHAAAGEESDPATV